MLAEHEGDNRKKTKNQRERFDEQKCISILVVALGYVHIAIDCNREITINTKVNTLG